MARTIGQCPQCGRPINPIDAVCACGQMFGPAVRYVIGQSMAGREDVKEAQAADSLRLRSMVDSFLPKNLPNSAAELARRKEALNVAFSVFQVSCCGMAGDGDMDHDDIMPLAREIERYIAGD